jgi:NADH-quinone oxidoreductase subunit L
MTRLMSLTFWGKSRVPKEVHPHESPWIMTVPLTILAILSVIGGWIGIPHVIGSLLPGHPENILEKWFEPVVKQIPNMPEADVGMEWGLMGVSVLLAAISAGLAYVLYVKKPEKPKQLAKALGRTYDLVANKYLVDEAYQAAIIGPIVQFSKQLWYQVDVQIIDRTTYVLTDLVAGAGAFARKLQNGNIQQYALYIVLGVALTLSFILMR